MARFDSCKLSSYLSVKIEAQTLWYIHFVSLFLCRILECTLVSTLFFVPFGLSSRILGNRASSSLNVRKYWHSHRVPKEEVTLRTTFITTSDNSVPATVMSGALKKLTF